MTLIIGLVLLVAGFYFGPINPKYGVKISQEQLIASAVTAGIGCSVLLAMLVK